MEGCTSNVSAIAFVISSSFVMNSAALIPSNSISVSTIVVDSVRSLTGSFLFSLTVVALVGDGELGLLMAPLSPPEIGEVVVVVGSV